MRRQNHHFPSPRRERATQVYLSDDDSIFAPFLEVDQTSISLPVLYKRTLPKGIKLDGQSQDRRSLVVEHEPEVCEEEPVILQKVIEEGKKEEQPVIRLEVKTRDKKVKELRPGPQIVERRKEIEIPTTYDRISVVMAFRESGENRLEGLKKCIQCIRQQTMDCYIVLVEQDREPFNQYELEKLVDSYLFIYSMSMFNKSWAFNCGTMIAPDDLVLLHDCDLLVPRNYVKECMRILGTKDLALPWAKILYLTEESSKSYPEGHPKVCYTITSHQAVGGSLLVRKNFYLRIGGMDERFEGWGGEDNAFYAKAAKLGRISRVSPVTGMTLLHHHHKPAPKYHSHNHVNHHVLWQYYQGSDRDIMVRLRTLDPIGDPLKYRSKEESQTTGTKALHA